MPKIVDYPRASLKRSLELAHAVESLGGESTVESAAEALGNKVTGAFNALMSATAKYGLVTNKAGRLQITPLFRGLLLAYSDEERRGAERQAFMSVPLFREITARFSGKKLPVDYFEKLLMREFGVPTEMASRVAGYYTEGARSTGVLDEAGVIQGGSGVALEPQETSAGEESAAHSDLQPGSRDAGRTAPLVSTSTLNTRPEKYYVRIHGPDMDSTMEINDEDDLAIVEVMIKKVRRLIAGSGE